MSFSDSVMQVKRTQQRGNRNRVFNETWTQDRHSEADWSSY